MAVEPDTCPGREGKTGNAEDRSLVLVAERRGRDPFALSLALLKRGFDVVPVEDGTRVLELLCPLGPDAIVCHLDERGLGGLQLTRVLRGLRHHADVPVLVVSATDVADTRVATLQGLGGVWVVQEPADPAVVGALLTQMIATSMPARSSVTSDGGFR